MSKLSIDAYLLRGIWLLGGLMCYYSSLWLWESNPITFELREDRSLFGLLADPTSHYSPISHEKEALTAVVAVSPNYERYSGSLSSPYNYTEYQAFMASSPTPTNTDNLAIGTFASEDNLNEDGTITRWYGELYVPQRRNYSFSTTSDDWSFVVIDGTLVVDNPGLHAAVTKSGNINLAEGWHTFEVSYGEHGGGAVFSYSADNSIQYKGIGSDAITAAVFAIQASCTGGSVNDNTAYLILSEFCNADKVNFVAGSNYSAGNPQYDDAIEIGALPFQFGLGSIPNPSGSQPYTIRIFNGSSDQYIDKQVILNEQDCVVGCDCSEFIYLNEVTGSKGRVHKFEVDTNATTAEEYLIEIMTDGRPWYEGNDLSSPHGLGSDLNGSLYIGEHYAHGDIRKLSCDGTLFPEGTGAGEFKFASGGQFNIASIGNIIYYNPNNDSNNAYEIRGFNTCTGESVGAAQLCQGGSGEDWGFFIDPRTEIMYVTSSWSPSVNDPNYLFVFTEADFDNDNTTCIDKVLDLPAGDVRGVVTDDKGNIYVALQDDATASGGSVLYKYSPTYQFLGKSLEDASNDNVGYNMLIGLSYSESTGLIFASIESDTEDCISVFDTTLNYVGRAVAPPDYPGGGNGKGIAIQKECCPSNNNQTIEQVQCVTSTSDAVFLNEIFPCEGIVCGGTWTPANSESEAIFDACNQTIKTGAATGCYSFLRTSDGTGVGGVCGAYVQTFNLEIVEVEDISIRANTLSCKNATLTATTNAPNIQWQSSTTSPIAGFTDIPGATNATLATEDLTQTTYYRAIVTGSSSGPCSGIGGDCEFPSNVISVGGTDCLSLGNRVWIDDGTDTNSADDATNMGVPNNGKMDGDEQGVEGVTVYLFATDGNGNVVDWDGDGVVGNLGDVVDSTLTDGEGYYLFDELIASTYKVFLPQKNFLGSGPLANYVSSMGEEGEPDTNNRDLRDNGIDDPNPDQNGIFSAEFTLAADTEPASGATLDTEEDFPNGNRQGGATDDDNSNLTVDFGFSCPNFQCTLTDYHPIAHQSDIDVGRTHGMWLNFINYGSLNPSGTASGDLGVLEPYFNWQSGATMTIDNINQELTVAGIVRNSDDPSVEFTVSMKLYNCEGWDAYAAAGNTYAGNYSGLSGPAPVPDNESWLYCEMTGILTAVAPTKDFHGETFTIENDDYTKKFQYGIAANDKDGDLGMSGWYDVTRDSNGEVYRGDGNTDITSCLSGACNTPTAVLQPTMVIEGAYENNSNLMRTDLNGSIPVVGPDGTLANNDILNSPESDIVDWVDVSLLSTARAGVARAVVEKRSALLRADGGVVEVDGRSPLTFTSPPGEYFIMIEHRNHLNIVTENPVILQNGQINEMTFRGQMYCGDVNKDGQINGLDRAEVWNNRNKTGYHKEDVNLDGVVDKLDRRALWQNRNKQSLK